MKTCEQTEGLGAALSIFLASLHEVRAEISDETLALRVVSAVDEIAGSAARIRLGQQSLLRQLSGLRDLCAAGADADGDPEAEAGHEVLFNRVLGVCFDLTPEETAHLMSVLQAAVTADGRQTLAGAAGANPGPVGRLAREDAGSSELRDRLNRCEDELSEVHHENRELHRLVAQLRGELAAGSSLISRLNLQLSNLRGELGQRSPKARRPVGEPCIPAYLSVR